MNADSRLIKEWRNLVTETMRSDMYWRLSVLHSAIYEDMLPLIQDNCKGVTLDLGSGRLAWKEILQKNTEYYVSGDIMIWDPEQDLVLDAAKNLPFKDKTFDTIFFCSTLEHEPNPWGSFKEIARILKDDGKIILNLPFLYPVHDAPHDYYRFTRYGVEHMARQGGLRVESITTNGGLFHLVLNIPSMISSILLYKLNQRSTLKINTRFWLFLAKAFDNFLGLKDQFASNHIAILSKQLIN